MNTLSVSPGPNRSGVSIGFSMRLIGNPWTVTKKESFFLAPFFERTISSKAEYVLVDFHPTPISILYLLFSSSPK